MRRRFFVDRFDSNSASLRGDAAEHLGRVLRAAPGQLYELSDGDTVWLGRIRRVALAKSGKSEIEFELIEHIANREPSLRMSLLIAIVKFDRFEWCLEKATELGVTEIIPLAAARTDKPLLAAAEKRRSRWEKILLESAQQSRRMRVPLLRSSMRPAEAFAPENPSLKILLSEREDSPTMRELLTGSQVKEVALVPTREATPAPAREVALAIGPEGGWTDDEIEMARAAGFAEASLGPNILRTETAVIVALAVVGFSLGTLDGNRPSTP